MLYVVTPWPFVPGPGKNRTACTPTAFSSADTPGPGDALGRTGRPENPQLSPRPTHQGACLLSHRPHIQILRLTTLTLTIFFALLTPGWSQSDYHEPTDAEIQRERARAYKGLDKAQELFQDPGFSEALQPERRALTLPPPPSPMPSFTLPKTLPPNIPIADSAQAAAAAIRRDQNPHFLDERIRPLVLISFGLPNYQLRALLAEAKRLDAAVCLRGLINDEWKDTIATLHALALDGLGSVSIDPNTFERFHVSRVPTFILPLERIEPCTENGCPPVRHVRATGSTSLSYFLDYVTRVGTNDERHKAHNWLAAHQETHP